MVFNVNSALDYLRGCLLCNGMVIEFHNRTVSGTPYQRVFLFNQCALVAEAFRRTGDPRWMSIRDMLKAYFQSNGFYGATNMRNYFYPIISQEVVPHGAAFHPTPVDHFYFTGGPGTDQNPREVITNTMVVDDLSTPCSSMASNRALMRALYHFQRGETSSANTCYDYVLDNLRPEGFSIADSGDFNPGGGYTGWRYSTYKLCEQWITAYYMGRTRILSQYLDQMQDPSDGKVMQFCANNFATKGGGNTETTALAIIAHMLWNPGTVILPPPPIGPAPSPPPPPSGGVNEFGIKNIYAAKTGGGDNWASTAWGNGNSRTVGGNCDTDEDDSRLAHEGNDSSVMSIDGAGVMTLSRGGRCAVFGTFQNVETTVYVSCPTAMDGSGIVHLQSKTEHYCLGNGDENDLFGGYILYIDFSDDALYFKKEQSHNIGYSGRLKQQGVTINANTYYGFKMINYNIPNTNNVKLEAWFDSTGGASGGNWTKITEAIDDGTWDIQGDTYPPTRGVMREAGIRTDDQGSGSFFRYKWWTAREIQPAVTSAQSEPPIDPVPIGIPVTDTDPGNDSFGIRKVYPDVAITAGASTPYYMNMSNPSGDCRLSTNASMIKNGDGSYRLGTEARIRMFTSVSGCARDIVWEAANDVDNPDHTYFEQNGYMYNAKDWRNIELTAYVKVANKGGSGGNKDISLYARGWRHSDDLGCLGTGYRFTIEDNGDLKWAKISYHGAEGDCQDTITDDFGNIGRRSDNNAWLGLKFIMYNFVNPTNGRLSVHLEAWADLGGSNTWTKIGDRNDTGGWAADYTNTSCPGTTFCGSSLRDQIITWGGPTAYLDWSDYDAVDFKWLSCREIVPGSAAQALAE